MEHKSANGKTYEIGSLYGYKGDGFYDIVVIMYWPEHDENSNSPYIPTMVNWYFGDYEYEATEDFINQAEEDGLIYREYK